MTILELELIDLWLETLVLAGYELMVKFSIYGVFWKDMRIKFSLRFSKAFVDGKHALNTQILIGKRVQKDLGVLIEVLELENNWVSGQLVDCREQPVDR